MAKSFGKALRSPKFLGMLYTLKVMLPRPALNKTFQKGAINYSRIIPNIAKTKASLQQHFEKQPLLLLREDIASRLQRCNLVIDERAEESRQKYHRKVHKSYALEHRRKIPFRCARHTRCLGDFLI